MIQTHRQKGYKTKTTATTTTTKTTTTTTITKQNKNKKGCLSGQKRTKFLG